MAIRAATLDDVLRIREIRADVRENRLSHPERVSAADVVAFIERCGVWVWEEDGIILGFSAGDLADGTIWALFVDPSCEGRGIGQALIAESCAGLRAAGHTMATLTTQPGSRAERFYRRNGWTANGLDARGEMRFSKALV